MKRLTKEKKSVLLSILRELINEVNGLRIMQTSAT